MGIDRDYTSTMSSIAREVSTSRLSLLTKQRHYPMKFNFTPTSPLNNSADGISQNHGNQTILQPIILICSRHGDLREESSLILSFANSFTDKISSTKNTMGVDREYTSTMLSIAREVST